MEEKPTCEVTNSTQNMLYSLIFCFFALISGFTVKEVGPAGPVLPPQTPKPIDPCQNAKCNKSVEYCEPKLCVANCKYPPQITCKDITCTCGFKCIMANKPGCNKWFCKEAPICVPNYTFTCANISCVPSSICCMIFDKAVISGGVKCFNWPHFHCDPIGIFPVDIEKIDPPVVGPGPIPDPAASGGK